MAADEEIRKDYAAYVRGLIAELAQTHHASVAFHTNERHMENLSCALAQMPNRIKSLDRLREASLKRHKTSRDSSLRRFAFRLIGHAAKFESGADQHWQCYYNILHQEHKVKEEERSLREQHASVTCLVEDLEPVALRHKEMQDKLDSLFEELFAGAQDGDQEHMALKSDVESARQSWRNAQAASEHARLAVALLTPATEDMQKALSEVSKALGYGTLDGGYLVEKKRLGLAQAHVCAAQRRFSEAGRVVGPVASISMPEATYNAIQRYRQSGVYAKTGFRDMIRRYGRELDAYFGGLKRELARLQARREEAGAESKRRERAVEHAKGRLRAANTRAFLNMVGKEAWPSLGMHEAVTTEWLAPPAYKP